MNSRTNLTIILAAGEGTRMRSSLPKVLHPVASQTLLAHVLTATPRGEGSSLADGGGTRSQRRCRPRPSARARTLKPLFSRTPWTAHAVLAAREAIPKGADDLIIAFGDTPLISSATFDRLRAPLKAGTALVVLGFRAADPTGYGRLIVKGDQLASGP